MLLNEYDPYYTPSKPLYIIRKTPQNTLLTITSFIYSENSNRVVCSETNNPLISISKCKVFYHACFEGFKDIDVISFTEFREDYNSYMCATYNNECEFIKIHSNPSLPKFFCLNIDTRLIKTPEDYINYLKVLSDVPTLTLGEGVCSTSPIDVSSSYVLSMSPSKSKPKPYVFGIGYEWVPQYPYIHIIQEGPTYFLKYEFVSKLSDHEIKINELEQLWKTDVNIIRPFKQLWKNNPREAIKAQIRYMLEAVLFANFFRDSGIYRDSGIQLSMEVTECGMFSIFVIFNLDNLYDDYDFLKEIPLRFY